MNQEQLNAIKDRVAKATPGPWYSSPEGTVYLKHTQDVADVWTDNEELDATFIANAREDVPALVAEVERVRKALEEIMEDQAPIMEGWETTTYEIARQALGGEAHE